MLFKRGLLFLPLLLTSQLIYSPEVDACSCGQKPPVLAEYQRSTFAIIAQVTSVQKSDASQRNVHDIRSATLIVERVFKGSIKAGEEMVFAQGGGGDCVWTFSEEDVGRRFLLYLSGRRKGETIWHAFICGRSTSLEHAADDLLYLENETKHRGKTRLSGTLSFYQEPVLEGQDPMYKGLDGQKVRVIGEKKTYELVTNNGGVYEIYDLPAGSYTVQPEIPDGLKIDRPSHGGQAPQSEPGGSDTVKKPGFPVVLETGKHSFIDFAFGVNNAIRGRILDTDGKGMKDVCLDILPALGRASRYLYKSDCSDRDGSFEITGIPPGRYVIAINKLGKVSSSSPFKTFYYPNVFEREKAAIITIVAGQTIQDINIFAPVMEDTVTVEGAAFYSDGKPVVDGWVYFKAEKSNEGVDGDSRSDTDSSGRFKLNILKGLKGKLYSELFAYPGKYENCPRIEELLQSAERGSILRTNVIDVQADANVSNAVLRYPFPDCKKKEP
jgi:hypothetical protein